jgi:type IV pilus assembly protein PilN
MIRINLLPARRAKRVAAREPGSKDIVIGLVALAGAAAVVFLAVDQPKRSKLADLREANANLDTEIANKQKQLEGFDNLKKAADDAEERQKSIARLMAAKVVPAHVLHELSKIMKPNELPTMTEDMARKTGNGPESDPNKRFDLAWDPTHVWITTFVDNSKDGSFRLEGNAQAQVDIIQLSKRLQASVYFDRVSQQTEERVSDRSSGITYYKFVISGKVAY